MIYETIPSKYLVKTLDNMLDEFIKFINSDKYTPEQFFVDFICLMQQWLENSQEEIMECETSEGARRLGHNMVHLKKFYDEIANSFGLYFKTKEAMNNFMDANNSHQLTKDIVNIFTDKDGLVRLSSDIVGTYAKSRNVVKFLDSIGIKVFVRSMDF
jgi:hydroxymethylglutaryl-CoA reductase